jgi:hypothetical protein
MKAYMHYTILPALALTLLMCMTNITYAEITQCTPITTLPTTINTQGIYCLTSDHAVNLATGAAITINVNNVIIDLNGHKIGNLAAGYGTNAYGIYAYQKQNITIRNGTIRGFCSGIWLHDLAPLTASQGHLVENILADKNVCNGIKVNGRGNIVRRNQVIATGGWTGVPKYSPNGIDIAGPGNRITENDVVTITPTGGGQGCGIYMSIATDDSIVLRNRVTEAFYGINMINSSVEYRDNVTTGVTYSYSGGTDIGNNN